MKRLIRKIFDRLGYDIVKRFDISDAIQYNTLEETEKFYSDKAAVDLYNKGEVTKIVANNKTALEDHKLLRDGISVLDVSCGTGVLLKTIADAYPSIELQGTEFSQAALIHAQKLLPSAKFHLLNVEEAHLETTYDLVICSQVLEHLQQPQNALLNLMRMVKPGGHLFLSVPDGRVDRYQGHINFWSIASWSLFLKSTFPNYTVEVGYLKSEIDLFGLILNNN